MISILRFIFFTALSLTFFTSCGNEFSILLEKENSADYGVCTLYYVEYGTGTNDGSITRYRSDGSENVVLLTGLTGPHDCAVDTGMGYLFWIEDRGADNDLVKRALLNGTSETTILTQGSNITGPYGIALDIPAAHVFWTYPGYNWISRCDYNGTNQVDHLVESLSSAVYRVRIDPVNQYIYYSQDDIYRAPLDDGEPRSLHIDISSDDCNGIAIDQAGDMIYWTQGNGAIGRAQISNPSNKNEAYITGLTDPVGIDLDLANRIIYWTDRAEGRIYRAEMDEPDGSVQTVRSGLVSPVSVIVSQ